MRPTAATSFQGLLDRWRAHKRGFAQAFAKGAPGWDALVRLGDRCHAFTCEIVPGDHDRTLFRAGQRDAFFFILDHLHFDAEQLIELYKATRQGDT